MSKNKNDRRNTIIKVVIIIVTIAMVVSTFASIFSGSGKGKSSNKEGNTTEVTENTVKEQPSKNLDDSITDDMKKDMEKAKIDVKGNKVLATVTINGNINSAQTSKILDEYTNNLKNNYKNKDLVVKIEHNKQVISQSTISNVATGKDLPKAQVEVSPGVMEMDRYVKIVLDTKSPEKYSVSVLGKKLEFVKDKKFFHNVIDSTDVNAIKKNIKILANK